MTDVWDRPVPDDWAAAVIAESRRLWLEDWEPGDALPLAPLTDEQKAARRAAIDAQLDAQIATEDARRRAAIDADPELRRQWSELLGEGAGRGLERPAVGADGADARPLPARALADIGRDGPSPAPLAVFGPIGPGRPERQDAGPVHVLHDARHGDDLPLRSRPTVDGTPTSPDCLRPQDPATVDRLQESAHLQVRTVDSRPPRRPSLVTEGIPQQHVQYTDRFSQQRSTDSGVSGPEFDGNLALQPSREARDNPDPTAHDGHDCCQDRTKPRTARALVGRRPAAADGDLGVLVLALRCRSWRCPCCKHRLRSRNRKRALRGTLRRGDQVWFATITIDPSHPMYRAWLGDVWPKRSARAAVGKRVVGRHGGTIESGGRLLTGRQAIARQSIPYVSASWNRLRLSLDREFGGKLRYYRAIELHESGMAHVHLLLRTGGGKPGWFLAFAAFRRLLVQAGFGRVTDVQLIASKEKAARYVTKMTAGYTSKSAEQMPRWTRRGTWSRDWCDWEKPTPIAGFLWELSRSSADVVADGFLADGYRLLDPGAYRIRPAPA